MSKFHSPRKSAGFTLLELILVIIIGGVLFAGGTKIFLQGLNTYAGERKLADINFQYKLAMARLERDFQAISSRNSITSATANSLTFLQANGTSSDSYSVTNNNLNITDTTYGTQLLANGIQSMTLAYYDRNGIAITTLTSATYPTICFIKVTLGINGGDASFSTSSIVMLRNIN